MSTSGSGLTPERPADIDGTRPPRADPPGIDAAPAPWAHPDNTGLAHLPKRGRPPGVALPPAAEMEAVRTGAERGTRVRIETGPADGGLSSAVKAAEAGGIPVTIYLPDEAIQSQVEAAVEQWLSTAGLSVDASGES